MSLESTNLPDDVQSLKQIIFSLQLQNDHLQEMVRLLQNEIFGRKSEALPAVNSNQLPLFASDAPVEPIEKDDDIVVPAHTRKNTVVNRCPRICPGSRLSTICRKPRNAAPAAPN
jgi:hypothetical protein